MKKLAIQITVMLVMTSFIAVGQDRTKNAGDKKPNTESKEAEGDQQNDELIGNDNQKKTDASGKDASDAYRNNKVNGNPNNTDVNEGSNRESTSPASTNESSKADDSGNAQNGQNAQGGKADPQASNAPSVIQETSSQSGSPAMLAEDKNGRDGTNNVQRATPNMAGSPVGNQKAAGNVKPTPVEKPSNRKQQPEQKGKAATGNNASQKQQPNVKAMDTNPKLAKEDKKESKKDKKSRRRHKD
jgi:hypothetical protein